MWIKTQKSEGFQGGAYSKKEYDDCGLLVFGLQLLLGQENCGVEGITTSVALCPWKFALRLPFSLLNSEGVNLVGCLNLSFSEDFDIDITVDALIFY